MKRALLAVILTCAGAAGQTRQEAGKQLLQNLLKAVGGDAFLAMRDRTEAGRAYSFYREELHGLSVATIYTRYTTPSAPGALAVRERESFGKQERDGAVLFQEDKGWEVTFRGARPIPDDRFQRYRDNTLRNVFYILRQRLKEPGMIFEGGETDILENVPVVSLDITDAENRTLTVYLDRRTNLPVRQMYVWRDPKTKDRNEDVTLFSKYRDVGGGVQWPYDIQRLRNGERNFQLYSDSVTINDGLTDELFTLSSKLKILPKNK